MKMTTTILVWIVTGITVMLTLFSVIPAFIFVGVFGLLRRLSIKLLGVLDDVEAKK